MSWTIIYKHAKLLLAIYWRRFKRFLGKNELEELEKWYDNIYLGEKQFEQTDFTNEWWEGSFTTIPLISTRDRRNEIEFTMSTKGQHLDWKPFNQELLNKLPRTPMRKGRLGFIKTKAHETEQEKAMHKWQKEHENNPPKYNFGE